MLTRRSLLRSPRSPRCAAAVRPLRPGARRCGVEEGHRGREEGRQGRRLQRRRRHAGAAEGGAAFEAKYGIRVELLEARASELRERIRTEQAAGKVLGDVSHNGSTTTALQLAEGTFQPYGALPERRAAGGAVQGRRHPRPDLRDHVRHPRQHRHGEAGRGAEELEGPPRPAVEGQDPVRRHARARRRRRVLHGHRRRSSARSSTRSSPSSSRT